MILDIIGTNIDVAGEMEFTADDSVLEVLVNPPTPPNIFFTGLGGLKYFEPGDNILLTGMWINIPFGFGQGAAPVSGLSSMQLAWETGAGAVHIIPELSSSGDLVIPNLCGPLEFPPEGLWILVPKNLGPVRLILIEFDLNVSMVNLPSVLDGEVIKVQVFLRVNHTLPLLVAP